MMRKQGNRSTELSLVSRRGTGDGASRGVRGHDPAAAPGNAATYLCLGPGFSSACNTPFRRHKTWVHEGGISTPFVVHWPAGLKAKGELRHTPAHFIDFRIGDWKLVAATGGSWELYDMKTDRAEQHNLVAKMPEKAKELGEIWQKQTDAFIELVKKPQ